MPLLGLIGFLWILGIALIWPVLPFQALAFGATPLLVTLLFAIDTAVVVLASPLIGRISDRVGRRPVMAAALIVGAVGLLYMATAESLLGLFLARALGGLSLAAMPVLQAALSDITTDERRIVGLSTYSGVYSAAFVFGPLATWQALELFDATLPWIALLAGAVTFLACGLLLASGDARRPAPAGMATEPAGAEPATADPAATGKAGGIWRGLMIASYLVPLSAIVLAGFAHSGWDAIFAVWAEQSLSWGGAEVAVGYAVAGSCAALTQFLLAPRLCRWLGELSAARLSLLAGALGLLLLALGLGAWSSFAALGLIGAAIATVNSCLLTQLSKAVPAEHQGGALGLASSALSLAWLVGPLAAGLAFDAERPGLPFALGAAACLAGAVILTTLTARRPVPLDVALRER